MESLLPIAVVSLALVVPVVILRVRGHHRVGPDQALIVNSLQGPPRVSFDSARVLPIVQRAEVMDLSPRSVAVQRRGSEGLLSRDRIRFDVEATALVRVNRTAEDVLRVATSIGVARAADPDTLRELFGVKLSEAFKAVARELDSDALLGGRQRLRERALEALGTELGGFVVEDLTIERFGPTPLQALDPQNILDAASIRRHRSGWA